MKVSILKETNVINAKMKTVLTVFIIFLFVMSANPDISLSRIHAKGDVKFLINSIYFLFKGKLLLHYLIIFSYIYALLFVLTILIIKNPPFYYEQFNLDINIF
jgi:hypothetical protein